MNKEKTFDLYNGEKWIKVDEEYLDDIPDKDKIEDLELMFGKLIVNYKNNTHVAWKNIFGTWGHPTTIE